MSYTTATGDFNYYDLFYGERLDDLIFYVHKKLSEKLHWKYTPLKRGSFGYDSIACSIGFLLSNKSNNIRDCAEIVHNSWVSNYLFWSKIKPYELLPEYYLHPTKSLNDKRRKKLSKITYNNLPEKEKETNRIIVKILFDYFKIKY